VQRALLATAYATAASAPQLAPMLANFEPADWSALVEQALAHGTTSLLCRGLTELGPHVVPTDLLTACGTYLAARERSAQEALSQLASVVDRLAAAGITALPYKGPVFGLQAYGDPAMREFQDLDFLIRREDISRSLAILGELGYQSEAIKGLRARRIEDYYHYNGHDILFAPGQRLPIEPHWALSPRTFCADLDTAPIFDRAVMIETPQGRRFACFSPEDTLLAAATHGGKEQWSRLAWVADIAALLRAHPTIDWHAVLDRAKRTGCLRMALLAAELARALFDADLPDHVCAAIARDGKLPELAEHVRARLSTRPGPASVFTLTMFRWNLREHFTDRLRYAWRTLLAARVPHFRNLDLPDWLSFLYPAVRLGLDFVMLPVWKALKQLRVRTERNIGAEGEW